MTLALIEDAIAYQIANLEEQSKELGNDDPNFVLYRLACLKNPLKLFEAASIQHDYNQEKAMTEKRIIIAYNIAGNVHLEDVIIIDEKGEASASEYMSEVPPWKDHKIKTLEAQNAGLVAWFIPTALALAVSIFINVLTIYN